MYCHQYSVNHRLWQYIAITCTNTAMLTFVHHNRLTHWPLGDLHMILKMLSSILLGIFKSSYDNVLRWMPQDLTDDKSTLVQVMAWCRQATSHYLNQCWPRSPMPYGVTGPQWVNFLNSIHVRCLTGNQYKDIWPYLVFTNSNSSNRASAFWTGYSLCKQTYMLPIPYC